MKQKAKFKVKVWHWHWTWDIKLNKAKVNKRRPVGIYSAICKSVDATSDGAYLFKTDGITRRIHTDTIKKIIIERL